MGGKYTIADLCCFSWINWAEWAGVETKPFPELHAWLERIQQRPAVQRGVDVPTKFEMKEKMKSKEVSRIVLLCRSVSLDESQCLVLGSHVPVPNLRDGTTKPTDLVL